MARALQPSMETREKPVGAPRGIRGWRWLVCTSVYISTVIIYFVVPLGTRWPKALIGTSEFAPDVLLNAGILEWDYRQLFHGSVFDWNAGFPLRNSLAGTENLLGWQLFYYPLRAIGVGNVSAYNLLLVGSFVLSGLGLALLARQWGASTGGATVAGFIFAFLPFHQSHFVHIQTMAICWTPFAVLFLDRLLGSPNWKEAAGLVVMLVMTQLSGMYIGIFFLIVIPTYTLMTWVSGRHGFSWSAVRFLGVTVLVGVAAVFPVYWPYLIFASDNGLTHSTKILIQNSIGLTDLVEVPRWQALWSGTRLVDAVDYLAAFPGVISVLATTSFFGLNWKDKRRLRLGFMLLILCAIFAALSFGPVLKLHGRYPSHIGGHVIPMPGVIFSVISMVRTPMRILFEAYLFVAVLAGLGTTSLLQRVPRQYSAALTIATVVLLGAEYRPSWNYAGASVYVPAPIAMSDAYSFLAHETNRGGVIELPNADTAGYRAPILTRYVYGSSGHLRRVVAYHASVSPPILEKLERDASALPDDKARSQLLSIGVTRLVIHKDLMTRDAATRLVSNLNSENYRQVYSSPASVVFALDTPSTPRRAASPR